ncbi:MAG: transposase [Brevundimonas sp.]|uniref:transposase n=1 Tax=Brevundimonas sp. TaxID=1871086 RepID=UPI00391FB73E
MSCAAVRVEAHDRKRLEQLCRFITRPALSDERVRLNTAGQVALKLKMPWRDGTTHLVLRRGATVLWTVCASRGARAPRGRGLQD